MASKQLISVLYSCLILSTVFAVARARDDDNSVWGWVKCLGAPVAVGVGTFFAAPVVAAAVVGAAGFTTAGIAAGSVGATAMSAAAIANGGGVVAASAGGVIATLQSVGAAGLGVKAAATAAAGAAYVTKKNTDCSDSVNGKCNGN